MTDTLAAVIAQPKPKEELILEIYNNIAFTIIMNDSTNKIHKLINEICGMGIIKNIKEKLLDKKICLILNKDKTDVYLICIINSKISHYNPPIMVITIESVEDGILYNKPKLYDTLVKLTDSTYKIDTGDKNEKISKVKIINTIEKMKKRPDIIESEEYKIIFNNDNTAIYTFVNNNVKTQVVEINSN
jgi:hypothetical protein